MDLLIGMLTCIAQRWCQLVDRRLDDVVEDALPARHCSWRRAADLMV